MDGFVTAKTSAETEGTDRSLKFRKSVRKFIIGFTAIVLLGASTYFWQHRGERSPEASREKPSLASTCLPFSSTEVHRCTLSEKPQVFTAEKIAYGEVLNFCIVKPRDGSYQAKQIGPNTFEIKSEHGALPIEYKLLGGACPDQF